MSGHRNIFREERRLRGGRKTQRVEVNVIGETRSHTDFDLLEDDGNLGRSEMNKTMAEHIKMVKKKPETWVCRNLGS
jgi:hypothetical protein